MKKKKIQNLGAKISPLCINFCSHSIKSYNINLTSSSKIVKQCVNQAQTFKCYCTSETTQITFYAMFRFKAIKWIEHPPLLSVYQIALNFAQLKMSCQTYWWIKLNTHLWSTPQTLFWHTCSSPNTKDQFITFEILSTLVRRGSHKEAATKRQPRRGSHEVDNGHANIAWLLPLNIYNARNVPVSRITINIYDP